MLDTLTRETLYEKIWSQPLAKVAAELSCSKERLATRCRRERIPTPSTGYWRKIDFGHPPKRPPLPPASDLPEIKPLPDIPMSPWPRDSVRQNVRIQTLRELLDHQTPDHEGLINIRAPLVPRVSVSKKKVEVALRLANAILNLVEKTGVQFKKARSKHSSGYFEHAQGNLFLAIEEPTDYDKSTPAWQPSRRIPSGHLKITIEAEEYRQAWRKSWIEGKDGVARELPQKVAEGITERYRDLVRQAAEALAKQKSDHEEWLRKEEIRKKEEHDKDLETTRLGRAQDLFRAAEWMRLFEQTLVFVAQCEARWGEQGPLTPQQTAWLVWARQTAEVWSPTDYPNPTQDGTFDPETVPFGGPYPPVRNYPRPPTMPELVAEHPSATSHYSQPKQEPYPFWLRYPRK